MIYHDVEQNTLQWRYRRMGMPTSSNFDRIMTPKLKPSKQVDGYAFALLAEFVVGHPILEPSYRYMEQGHEREPEAIAAAEFTLELETTPGGYVTLNDGSAGCSPDRLIGTDSILEIKCPKESTHVRYMLTRESDEDYMQQLQGQLWITERQSVIICSYHPEIVPVLITVQRDETYIATLSSMVRAFTDRLSVLKEKLVREYGPFPVPEIEKLPAKRGEELNTLGITEDEADELIAAHARGDLKPTEIRQRFKLPEIKRPPGKDAFDLHMEGS